MIAQRKEWYESIPQMTAMRMGPELMFLEEVVMLLSLLLFCWPGEHFFFS